MTELLAPRSWPVLSGTVPGLARGFSRRPETGHGLWDGLRPGVTVIVGPDGDRTASAGSRSGTGKTQLAAACARRMWAGAEVDLLVWLDAYSRDRIVTGYARALADLRLAAAPGKPEAAAARFLAWLADTGRRWLVVLDGVNDPADIEGLWPRGPSGQALITTAVAGLGPAPARHGVPARKGSQSGSHQVSIGLAAFSQREAMEYLTDRLNDDPYHSAGAIDLAASLGCLPVGLDLAVAYLLDTGQECRQYRLAYEQYRRDWNGGTASDTLAPAWMLAIDRARQFAPAELAWPTLTLAAVLCPAAIPGIILTSGAACAYVIGRPAVTEGERASVRAAFGNLQQVGLVTIEPESEVRTVRMSAALQLSIRQILGPAGVRRAVQAAADAISESWPDADVQAEMEQALRDCALSLRRCDEPALWHPSCHPLLIRVGQSLDDAGMAETALGYWRAIARRAAEYYGARSPLSFQLRERLANAATAAGHFDEAIGLREELAADIGETAGSAHPQAIISRAGLAGSYRAAGRLIEAISLGALVAADGEKVLGPVHTQTRKIQCELGSAYCDAGQYREAIELLNGCLTISAETIGIMHPETASARKQLAEAYRLAGRVSEAIALYQEALAQVQKAVGGTGLDAVIAREDLALAYYRAGRTDDAATSFERALAEWRRVGADAESTLAARTSLAAIYCESGRSKQAIPLYESVLTDCNRIHGPAHPDTFRARRNGAAACHHAKRYTETVDLGEALLEDCERTLGQGHRETLTVRANLAHAYHSTGRLKRASAHFDRAVRDCEQAVGPDDQLTSAVRELRQRYLGGRQGTAPIISPPGELPGQSVG